MFSRPNCIYEIHQRWQSGFSRVYSISGCSCSFEAKIIKIGKSSTTILTVWKKKLLETYWMLHVSNFSMLTHTHTHTHRHTHTHTHTHTNIYISLAWAGILAHQQL